MKKRAFIWILLFLTVLSATAQPRKITGMDADWRFHRGDAAGAELPSFNDTGWRKLDVPHDWSIEGENLRDNPGGGSIGFFPTGIGWYRKTFDVKTFDKKKRYAIEFDGVYMNSTVKFLKKKLSPL